MSILGMFSFFFALGTLLYVLVLPFWASVLLFILALFAILGSFWMQKRKRRSVRLIALGMAMGLLWSGIYDFRQLRPVEALAGEEIRIRMIALEDEEKTVYGSKVLCKSGNVRILTYIFDCKDSIYAGDEIVMQGILEATTGENDLHYIAKEIHMTARQNGDITVLPGEHTLRNLPARVYGSVCRRIIELFPEDTASFALALLTGDTGKLSYGFRNDMALAGISHVVAVSGMHVSLICSLVLHLCLRRKRLAAGFCLGAMWFFGAMLGFSPSVTRAVVMNSIFLLAPILNREYDSPTALGTALLVLLLKNPFSIASQGLQLSFASVAGIILLTAPLTQRLQDMLPAGFRERRLLWGACSFLTTSVATTVGASLFTVPLGAYYFGTVSLISFVSNLVLLPLITLIFTLGYPLVILSYGFYPMAKIIGEYISIPIRWITMGIELLAEIPYGALYSRSAYVVLWLIASYILLALGIWLKRKRTALLLCMVMLISVPIFQKIHLENLRVTMLDVGQGQCVLAEMGEYVAILDCGGTGEDAVGENVSRELFSRGYDGADALILTHFDLDHCGGVLQLLDRVEIGAIYLPDISPENEQRERILQKAEEMNIPVNWVREDLRLCSHGGILDVFAPVTTNSENDGLCLLLSYEDYDILITGDLSIRGELELIQTKPLPHVEVLIAGHHGASDSTGQSLLEHIMPEELLISVGRNSYGHPSAEALDRARNFGIRVRRTDQEGNIVIKR